MFILQEKSCFLNMQCLFVGRDFDSLIGRFAVVKLNDERTFICRIWSRPYLRCDFCFLDPTVEVFSKSVAACLPRRVECQRLSRDCIEVIPKIGVIRSVNVSVVFEDPWKRTKWVDREESLVDCLKDVLKLFVVCSNSVIHLNRLKGFRLLGVRCVNVLSVGIQGFGRVISKSKVKIDSKISSITYDQLHCEHSVKRVFHLDAYEELKNVLSYRSKRVKRSDEDTLFLQHVLLIGAGGCGKSSLLFKVCFDQGVVVLNLDLSEIFSLKCEERQAFFKKKLDLARALSSETKSGLCLILIERIENVKSKSGKSLVFLNSFLVNASQEPNVVVVATTDSPHSLDSSLRSANKFSIEIYLSLPGENERCVIISDLCSKFNLTESSCLYLAQNTPGFVLSDLVLIARRATKIISSQNSMGEEDILNVLVSCVKTVQPVSTRGAVGLVSKSEYDINRIGGLDEIKSKLLQVIVWPILNGDSFKRMNIPSPSGVLLYGPPGCAKTSLVRAVASSCNTTFLSVSAADLYSPFVGDAEKTVSQLFQRARASAPTVLFVDEIDALVGSRTYREKGVQERILSSFLTELDGVGHRKDTEHSLNGKYHPSVIIIAATNRPQVVDSALLRPGRFDKLIYVPPPNKNERLSILNKITENLSLDKSISLLSIAEKTEYYSGADLINLCREAGLHAVTVCGTEVDLITEEHFDHALSILKPSLSANQINWYREFKFC